MNSLLTNAIAIAANIISLMLRTILERLDSFSPVWGISIMGFMTGIIILLVFRYASDATKITAAKNRLKGDLLEIWLYNHDVKLVLKNQLRLFLSSIGYIGHTIVPLILLSFPVGGIITLMENWYDARPLAAGEDIIVTLKLDQGWNASLDNVRMELPDHVEFATPPVRISILAEISWKLRARVAGNAPLRCGIEGEMTEIPLEVSENIRPVFSCVHRTSLTNVLLFFGSALLPAKSKLESVRLGYPERDVRVLGMKIHWLLLYFIVTMLSVLLLMKKFRVTL